MRWLASKLARIGFFIWDFLVGDTPEILVLALAIVGITFWVRSDHLLSVVILPVCVAVGLIAVVRYGQRRARKSKKA
ncbi:MAG: hypothetical protein ACRDVP_06245 [Acidimicrobiales bacterium]